MQTPQKKCIDNRVKGIRSKGSRVLKIEEGIAVVQECRSLSYDGERTDNESGQKKHGEEPMTSKYMRRTLDE